MAIMPLSENGAGSGTWLRFLMDGRSYAPDKIDIGVNVIKSLSAVGVIAAMLLSAWAHRARAQQQKDDPPPPINEQSADWERAAEGLKKAKPIPEPSHPVT